ncbi:MAG TPA: hypothetical protein VF244_10960 [Acidimicrobiales bacterium]
MLTACPPGCGIPRGVRYAGRTPRGFTQCSTCLGLRWSPWPTSTALGRREYLTALAAGLARLVAR